MVTAALRPLLRSVERAPVPVLFMLDEVAQIGRMAMIENNIAQMRGFGVKLWTVWQHVEQMKKTYKDAWPDFMATAQAKITFTAEDNETREYFSKLGGERLFTHPNHSVSVTESHRNNWGASNSSGATHTAEKSSNRGQSSGQNWGFSRNESIGEQRINERCVRPHELAALDAIPRDIAIMSNPFRLPRRRRLAQTHSSGVSTSSITVTTGKLMRPGRVFGRLRIETAHCVCSSRD